MINESKGNAIFPDTTRINPKLIEPVRAVIQKELAEIGLVAIPVGSTYKSDPDKSPEEWSGDVDTMVDLDNIIAQFQAEPDPKNKKDSVESANRRALSRYFKDKGYETAQAGVNVFVRVPYGDDAYQVDLECIRKVSKVSRYHQHDIPKGSPWKGVNKQLLLAMLAKQKGYVYSAWEGLFVRTPDNKKGDLVTDEWDEIAEKLVGIKDGSKISSAEAILKSLPPQESQDLLARAKQDKNWFERQPKVNEGTQDWFRKMFNKLAEADAETSPKSGAVPTVDPKNYQVPSVEFLKKNYEHPADVIYGGTRSETDPERVGAWDPTSDFGELMLAWNAQYYRARQADPDYVEPKVPNDWELVRRLLSTPEGKEWAVEHWTGLSSISDKSPEAEFQRAQQKEFEKQRNARELAQTGGNGLIKPGWKYDPELGTTPAYYRSQQQSAAPAAVKEQLDAMLRIARLK